MNRMPKKTRKQKGGGFLSGLFHPRSSLPTDINDPNYLIDLLLYRGTESDTDSADDKTLIALGQYPNEYNPFKPTSHKGESLLDMAHKRRKIRVVGHLLLRKCMPMTPECYWDAINFIKQYPRYDSLWETINEYANEANKARPESLQINVLEPEAFKSVYSYDKKTGVYEELEDKSSLAPYLAKDGQPGLILPTTGASYRPVGFSTAPWFLQNAGKRTRKRKHRGRFRRGLR